MHEFAVLCARTDELAQVLKVLDLVYERRSGTHIADQVYRIPGKRGEFSLIAGTCNGMGNMNAAVRTTQIITSHTPQFLLFVGTAASLDPTKIQLGDVVIPPKALSRYYEKITEAGQKDFERRKNGAFKEWFFDGTALISNLDSEKCSPVAHGVSAALGEPELEGGATHSEITVGGHSVKLRAPKVHRDVDIFSCGLVVDSIAYRDFLVALTEESMRAAGVIDMESLGFFSAIKAAHEVEPGSVCQGLMVRGISDYAGRKQQGEELPVDWRAASVRNAATVAVDLIQRLASVD